jgi:transcriptional regulator with XRE-family HTH domain
MGYTLPVDGNSVRRRIALLGLTDSRFADLHGFDRAHLSRVLSGQRGISGPYLARLAEALGCDITDLIANEPVAS